MTSRRMRPVGRVTSRPTRNRRGAYRVLVGRVIQRDHWEGLDIDGRLILRWIFKTSDEEAVTVFLWLRIWIGGGLL